MFRELVRKNKQLTTEACIEVLKSETRGVLSVNGDDGYPYGMPMNHWYNEEDGCIYFHCGNVGYRLEMLKKDNKVSFCTYDRGQREAGEWAWNVKSVIIFGKIEILDDMDTIVDITTKLSYKFTDDKDFIDKHIENNLHRTVLYRVKIEHMTGKLVTES